MGFRRLFYSSRYCWGLTFNKKRLVFPCGDGSNLPETTRRRSPGHSRKATGQEYPRRGGECGAVGWRAAEEIPYEKPWGIAEFMGKIIGTYLGHPQTQWRFIYSSSKENKKLRLISKEEWEGVPLLLSSRNALVLVDRLTPQILPLYIPGVSSSNQTWHAGKLRAGHAQWVGGENPARHEQSPARRWAVSNWTTMTQRWLLLHLWKHPYSAFFFVTWMPMVALQRSQTLQEVAVGSVIPCFEETQRVTGSRTTVHPSRWLHEGIINLGRLSWDFEMCSCDGWWVSRDK